MKSSMEYLVPFRKEIILSKREWAPQEEEFYSCFSLATLVFYGQGVLFLKHSIMQSSTAIQSRAVHCINLPCFYLILLQEHTLRPRPNNQSAVPGIGLLKILKIIFAPLQQAWFYNSSSEAAVFQYNIETLFFIGLLCEYYRYFHRCYFSVLLPAKL